MLMVMSLITGFNGKVYLSHSIFEKVTQLDWVLAFHERESRSKWQESQISAQNFRWNSSVQV